MGVSGAATLASARVSERYARKPVRLPRPKIDELARQAKGEGALAKPNIRAWNYTDNPVSLITHGALVFLWHISFG